jgi:outer membrane receptor protein involved in Fe transport
LGKTSSVRYRIDFSLLDNRVSGSIVAFNRETSDLLQSVPLSLTSGHSSQSKNIGEVENKGVEIEFLLMLLELITLLGRFIQITLL